MNATYNANKGKVHQRTQRFLGELRKGKALKEIKFVDGLLKYKQSRVYYVPQGELRLLVLKEEHDSLIVGHRGEKPP